MEPIYLCAYQDMQLGDATFPRYDRLTEEDEQILTIALMKTLRARYWLTPVDELAVLSARAEQLLKRHGVKTLGQFAVAMRSTKMNAWEGVTKQVMAEFSELYTDCVAPMEGGVLG